MTTPLGWCLDGHHDGCPGAIVLTTGEAWPCSCSCGHPHLDDVDEVRRDAEAMLAKEDADDA